MKCFSSLIVGALVLATHNISAGAVNATYEAIMAEKYKELEVLQLEAKANMSMVRESYNAMIQAAYKMQAPLVMTKIIEMLIHLINKAEAEMKASQKEYDRFMCWCEATMNFVKSELTVQDNQMTELQNRVLSLKKNLARCQVIIEKAMKDMVKNQREQADAIELRAKQKAQFIKDEADNIATTAAVQGAIQALQGVQSASFLQSSPMRRAQLMGVAGVMRRLLNNPEVQDIASQDDMNDLQKFVDNPTDVTSQAPSSKPSLSVVTMRSAVKHNPFGDYAPGSTRIFGVLQGLEEKLVTDLADMRQRETDRIAAFEAFMQAKKIEQDHIANVFGTQMQYKARWVKELNAALQERKATDTSIVVEKDYMQETEQICREKARSWSERSHMRMGEMNAYSMAVNVLSGHEANTTFSAVHALARLNSPSPSFDSLIQSNHQQNGRVNNNTGFSFLQIHSQNAKVQEVQKNLMLLAKKIGSHKIKTLADRLRLKGPMDFDGKGGIFNEIIEEIDRMIKSCRDEEKADMKTKDMCDNALDANKRQKEQIELEIVRVARDSAVLQAAITEKRDKISTLDQDLTETLANIASTKATRETEHANYLTDAANLKESISYLKEAGDIVEKFFEDQGMPLGKISEIQKSSGKDGVPGPTGNASVFNGSMGHRGTSTPPPTYFDKKDGESYAGMEGSGATMVVGLLKQTYTDLEMELKIATKDENEAAEECKKAIKDMKRAIVDMEIGKVQMKTQKAEVDKKLANNRDRNQQLMFIKEGNDDRKAVLNNLCHNYATSWEKRLEGRAQEIAGLEAARRELAKHQIDRDHMNMAGVTGINDVKALTDETTR